MRLCLLFVCILIGQVLSQTSPDLSSLFDDATYLVSSSNVTDPYVYYWNLNWYPVPRPGAHYYYNFYFHHYCPRYYAYGLVQYFCWPEFIDVCDCPTPTTYATQDLNNYCWNTNLTLWESCEYPDPIKFPVERDIIPQNFLPESAPASIPNPNPDDDGVDLDPEFSWLDGNMGHAPEAGLRYYNWANIDGSPGRWCPYRGGYMMHYCDYFGIGGYCPCIDPSPYSHIDQKNVITGQGPVVDYTISPYFWEGGWCRKTFQNAIVFFQSQSSNCQDYPYNKFHTIFYWDIVNKAPALYLGDLDSLVPGDNYFDESGSFQNSSVISLNVSTNGFYWENQELYVLFFQNAVVYYRDFNVISVILPGIPDLVSWNGITWKVTTNPAGSSSSTGIDSNSTTSGGFESSSTAEFPNATTGESAGVAGLSTGSTGFTSTGTTEHKTNDGIHNDHNILITASLILIAMII